jgi:F0F1-type ATP synthase delta subunit
MVNISRRQLACYGVDQLVAGVAVEKIAYQLSAELVISKRTQEVDLLLDDILWELEKRGELARAVVTSTHELSAKLQEQIRGQVKKMAKVNEAVIENKIDKDIIGGLKITSAIHTWDMSIANKLAHIRKVS